MGYYGDTPKQTRKSRKVKGKGSPWGELATRDSIPRLIDVPGLANAIDRVVRAGDALIFGSTSDGGAVSITLLAGDNRYKLYAGSQAELEGAVLALVRDYPDPDDPDKHDERAQ